MTNRNLTNIIESLLFVSDSPLDLKAIRKVIPEADSRDIRQALQDLMETHNFREGGFWLCEVAGGFQFRTRPEYKEYVKRLVQPSPVRLSKAALETLAIIAYHQPIIRSDIEHIRGVDSGAIVRSLLERKLIRILGKKEIPGRPLIYGTTKRFLEVFNLRSLSDMPSLKEIEAFGSGLVAAEEAAVAAPESEADGKTTEEGQLAQVPEAVAEGEVPDTEDEAAAEGSTKAAAASASVPEYHEKSPDFSAETGPEVATDAEEKGEENGA